MPSHYRGRPDELLALDAYIKLVRAVNSVQARLLEPLHAESGLTEAQFGTLEAIYHLGPLTQSQLCAKILRSGSNLTTLIDALERERLVRRVRDERDRRVQVVHLTDRGRTLIETLLPSHVGRVTRLLGALTRDEQRELGRLCRKLGWSARR